MPKTSGFLERRPNRSTMLSTEKQTEKHSRTCNCGRFSASERFATVLSVWRTAFFLASPRGLNRWGPGVAFSRPVLTETVLNTAARETRQLEHALFYTKTAKAIRCPNPPFFNFLENVCSITRDVFADLSVASERKTVGEQKIVCLAIVQAASGTPPS